MNIARWLVLVAVTVLSGCKYLPVGYTSISEIMRNPAAFEMQTVKIRGEVTDANKLPLLDVRVYQLSDETGSILVLTQGNLPAVGKQVAILGQVENMMILAGQGLGLIVRETERLPSLSP